MLVLAASTILGSANAQNLVQNPSFELGTNAVETTITPASWPSLVGLWKFDNTASPLTATVGSNLTLSGSHTTIAGWSGPDNATRIGVGSYYTLTNPIGGNGGGSYTNEYTLLIDFRVNSTGTWRSFFQSNTSNSNDAELFLRNSDALLGVSAIGGYSVEGAITNVWHRLIISVDNGTIFRVYMDGRLINSGSAQAVDGRFSLEGTVLMFADNDGDDGSIDVSTVALFNTPLTEPQVRSLGKTQCSNWTGEGNFRQQIRNAGYPNAAAGTYYLYAGSEVGPLECSQDVDVSGYAADIDASAATFTFGGRIQTYNQSPSDNARIIVEYRNGVGTVLDSYDTGYSSTSGVWTTISDTRPAPVGTRTVRVRILSRKNNGLSNDAYYDDFSLTITTVLSANLVAFDLKPTNNAVEISWEVRGETDCDRYVIEKLNAKNEWIAIAEVKGHGTFLEEYFYSMLDNEILYGQTMIYRLIEQDFNGVRTIYPPKSIQIESDLNIYPNPNNGIDFTIDVENAKNYLIAIINAEGKVIYDQPMLQIGDFELNSGLYLIRLTNLLNGEIIQKRMIVNQNNN